MQPDSQDKILNSHMHADMAMHTDNIMAMHTDMAMQEQIKEG